MDYIGNRISIKQLAEDTTSIVILSNKTKLKNTLLFAWVFLWTVSGIVVFTQYFSLTDQDAKAAIIVWMGFWAYFEYKMIKAYFWRKLGMEKLKIKEGKLFYKRDISGKGKIKVFEADFIKDLRLIEVKEHAFFEGINNSYWMIAGEKIAFDYYGKEQRLGLQLEQEDAEKLTRLLRKKLS